MDKTSDINAEKALIGRIIVENYVYDDVSFLLPEDFDSSEHQSIFNCIKLLDGKVDEIVLGDLLDKQGKLEEIGSYHYLAEIANAAPLDGNPNYWAKIIKDHSDKRQLVNIAYDIGKKASLPSYSVKDLLIESEQRLSKITDSRVEQPTIHISEAITDMNNDLDNISSDNDGVIGLRTGLHDLDDILSGILSPDLIIVAGRPGMGKTAFALNMVDGIYKNDNPGASFIKTREMLSKQLVSRLIASNSKINTRALKTAKLSKTEYGRLRYSQDHFNSKSIYFNHKTSTINETCFEMRKLARKKTLVLGVVDYLQLMTGDKNGTREREISDISGKLKNLAIELDIPIIALSQLNRALENRTDKRPILSDLRESGAIEQDADIILFLYRDIVYNENTNSPDICEIEIAKHRNGPTGRIELLFHEQYTKFSNIPKYDSDRFLR
jgi:replicative DNA helicase